MRLDAGALDLAAAMAGGAGAGRALKRIKEQLRAVKDHGLGYGLLRYLNAQTGSAACGLCRCGDRVQLSRPFPSRSTRIGVAADDAVRLAGARSAHAAWPIASRSTRSPSRARKGPTLAATWTWASALLSQEEVRDLAQGWYRALEALVRHVEQPGAGGRSPCDLPLLALSQGEIERLESKYPQLEDVLPLSPLQEGLLFHSLYDARAPDVYTVQLVLALAGPLDSAALERAAQLLIERHGSLRAGFEHANLARPVQVIAAGVTPPWRSIDLALLDAARTRGAPDRVAGAGSRARFDLSLAAAAALHADPAWRGGASARPHAAITC